MASIILDSYELAKKREPKILETYDSSKFLIDKNSSVTNIDVIYEDSVYNRISGKATVMPKLLTPTESVFSVL